MTDPSSLYLNSSQLRPSSWTINGLTLALNLDPSQGVTGVVGAVSVPSSSENTSLYLTNRSTQSTLLYDQKQCRPLRPIAVKKDVTSTPCQVAEITTSTLRNGTDFSSLPNAMIKKQRDSITVATCLPASTQTQPVLISTDSTNTLNINSISNGSNCSNNNNGTMSLTTVKSSGTFVSSANTTASNNGTGIPVGIAIARQRYVSNSNSVAKSSHKDNVCSTANSSATYSSVIPCHPTTYSSSISSMGVFGEARDCENRNINEIATSEHISPSVLAWSTHSAATLPPAQPHAVASPWQSYTGSLEPQISSGIQAPCGGFQLARDPVTGQIILIPTGQIGIMLPCDLTKASTMQHNTTAAAIGQQQLISTNNSSFSLVQQLTSSNMHNANTNIPHHFSTISSTGSLLIQQISGNATPSPLINHVNNSLLISAETAATQSVMTSQPQYVSSNASFLFNTHQIPTVTNTTLLDSVSSSSTSCLIPTSAQHANAFNQLSATFSQLSDDIHSANKISPDFGQLLCNQNQTVSATSSDTQDKSVVTVSQVNLNSNDTSDNANGYVAEKSNDGKVVIIVDKNSSVQDASNQTETDSPESINEENTNDCAIIDEDDINEDEFKNDRMFKEEKKVVNRQNNEKDSCSTKLDKDLDHEDNDGPDFSGLQLLLNGIERVEHGNDKGDNGDTVHHSSTNKEIKKIEQALTDDESDKETDKPLPANSLEILCALADQRFLEENQDHSCKNETMYRYRNRKLSEQKSKCGIETATAYDGDQIKMRIELARLQKKYRETRRELDRLTMHKKYSSSSSTRSSTPLTGIHVPSDSELHTKDETVSMKRRPGRPRKYDHAADSNDTAKAWHAPKFLSTKSSNCPWSLTRHGDLSPPVLEPMWSSPKGKTIKNEVSSPPTLIPNKKPRHSLRSKHCVESPFHFSTKRSEIPDSEDSCEEDISRLIQDQNSNNDESSHYCHSDQEDYDVRGVDNINKSRKFYKSVAKNDVDNDDDKDDENSNIKSCKSVLQKSTNIGIDAVNKNFSSEMSNIYSKTHFRVKKNFYDTTVVPQKRKVGRPRKYPVAELSSKKSKLTVACYQNTEETSCVLSKKITNERFASEKITVSSLVSSYSTLKSQRKFVESTRQDEKQCKPKITPKLKAEAKLKTWRQNSPEMNNEDSMNSSSVSLMSTRLLSEQRDNFLDNVEKYRRSYVRKAISPPLPDLSNDSEFRITVKLLDSVESHPLRVLVSVGGLFRAGELSAVRAPDLYGIKLDGERGQRTHIYTKEEVLRDVVLEVKGKYPLKNGTRVCAFWSTQYLSLYPGFVTSFSSSDESEDEKFTSVEFDDGDSGRINMNDIRLLPKDFAVSRRFSERISDSECNFHPRKRRISNMSYEEIPVDKQLHSPSENTATLQKTSSTLLGRKTSSDLSLENDHKNALPADEESTIKSSDRDEEQENKHECKHKDKPKCEEKRSKKKRKEKLRKSSNSCKRKKRECRHSCGWERDSSKIRKRHKHKHKHRKHHKRKRSSSCTEYSSKNEQSSICSKPEIEDKNSGHTDDVTSLKQSHDPIKWNSSCIDNVADDKDVWSLSPEVSNSHEGNSSSESTPEQMSEMSANNLSSASSSNKQDKVDEDSTKNPNQEEKAAPSEEGSPSSQEKHDDDDESTEEKDSEDSDNRFWDWYGKGFKRNGKGRAKKEFFRSIKRGNVIINVGDCAVFLTAGSSAKPFIGRIESMWESYGSMMVRVNWFYHPEETTGLEEDLPYLGALFESPHNDKNEVQTISHKCEVVSLEEYKKRLQKEPDRVHNVYKSNDLYYLAGYYDPTAKRLTFEKDVIS